MSAETPKRGVGHVIRNARKAAGLSQRDLARQLGVSAGAVAQWELGTHNLARARLAAASKALGLPLQVLLGDTEEASAIARQPGIALDAALIDEARQLGIQVNACLNAHLDHLVRTARAQRWLDENRDAIADANDFIDRHGLWSDGKRQF